MPNRDFKFPIKVGKSGRYFVDQKNKPFFWLGETGWPMLSQFPTEIAEQYIRRRGEQGFNVIQTVMLWCRWGTGHETNVPAANVNGDRPFLDKSFKKINEVYFDYVEQLLEIAAECGIILALWPTWGHFITQTRSFKKENAYNYGHWLGRRFKNIPNIVWMPGGDRQAWGFEDVYEALARGLRKGDQGKHMIGFHPCGARSSTQYFADANWLDFHTIQTWGDWPWVYGFVASDVALTPTRPVVMSEPGYENGAEYPKGPMTPLIMRRQAWWTFMAGGFFSYGQNQMWRMDPGWEKTFDTPGALNMGTMKEIVTARKWWDLVPDQSVIMSGVSSERSLNTAMRSRISDLLMIYLSSQCTVWICLGKIKANKCRAFWIHPATGEKKDAGVFETGNPGKDGLPTLWPSQIFSTPGFWEDAVLIVEGV